VSRSARRRVANEGHDRARVTLLLYRAVKECR
jgi:hypothetical protein